MKTYPCQWGCDSKLLLSIAVALMLVPFAAFTSELDRQGGEDWNDAFPIPGLPFEETGTTAGYEWDAFWGWGTPWCPIDFYGTDVFYSFVPAHDMVIEIDLCGTDFESRLGVRDSELGPVDCRDYEDCFFYYGPSNPCGHWAARLPQVQLTGGELYYIFVGNWAMNGYPYTISVREVLPVTVTCPLGGFDEGEPDIGPGYSDSYNSGCSGQSPDEPVQELPWDGTTELVVCGNNGWIGSGLADTDWFSLTAQTDDVLTISLDAEMPCFVAHLSPPDCETYEVQEWALARGGEPAQIDIEVTAGELIWLFVAPRNCHSDVWPDTVAFDYVMSIQGGAVTVENASWSTVKAMFR